MAKLKGPLMSLGASGQLGQTLVYFPWKGVNAVRTYVVPANPQTTAQTTQRNLMTAATAAWHAAPYTALDRTAWNRLAGIAAKIMSGFNRMVQEHITEGLLGNTWERLRNVTTSGVAQTTFAVDVQKIGGGNAPTIHYGTRKTHFPYSVVCDDIGGAHWAGWLPALTKDTLYYFYVDVGSSGTDFARTGIYQQRTTA